MAMQAPVELLLDLFAFLQADELFVAANQVCHQWNIIIEKNARMLSRKVLDGKFEVKDFNTMKYSKNASGVPISQSDLFWNQKFIIGNLRIDHFPYHFGVVQKLHSVDNTPMPVENLILQNSITPASYFLDDYETLRRVIQPKHVQWKNIGHRLADLKLLKASNFFQSPTIKTLDVVVDLPTKRPFGSMTIDELVDFIANADNNPKSQKRTFKIQWNHFGAFAFARRLVQEFISTKEPKLFFQEIVAEFEHKLAIKSWIDFFVENGTLLEVNSARNGRFQNVVVYEISRRDGWKIGLDIRYRGETKFHIYHASEIKSVSTSEVLDLAF